METWTDFRIHARRYHGRYQVHCFGIYYLHDCSRDPNKILCTTILLIFNCFAYRISLFVCISFKKPFFLNPNLHLKTDRRRPRKRKYTFSEPFTLLSRRRRYRPGNRNICLRDVNVLRLRIGYLLRANFFW